LLAGENISGGVPGVGDNVGRAGDGVDEARAVGLIRIGEGSCRGGDVAEAAGGVEVVGDGIFNCGSVLELPAIVAAEGVAAAVKGAGEVRDAVGVEVVSDGFRGGGQGGGIVGEGEGRAVCLGFRDLAAKRVIGTGDCRGGVRVGGGGEAYAVVVAVSGDQSARPGAGGEAAGGGVGVVGPFAIGVLLAVGAWLHFLVGAWLHFCICWRAVTS